MGIAVGLSVGLVLATIYIHFEALRWTSVWVPRCHAAGRARVLLVVVGAFAAHMLEVLLYAGAYFALEHGVMVGGLEGLPADSWMDYFYYSIVMYTSLGLGDVFPVGHLRIISGIEALNGLVLIGWSTSFTFLAMRRFWPLEVTEPAP
jgi:ion channel